MAISTPKIRSYVRREGRLTYGQERGLAEGLPLWGVDWVGHPLNFKTLFGREAPVILEIGFGMGDALVAVAEQHPEQNYIGIEVHRPGIGKCLLQCETHGLTNVRVCVGDAVEVLIQSVPDASLSRINIYFPDPWPKLRHQKRRLIQTEFVNLIAEKLKPEGLLHLATDWQHYAEQMLAVCSANANFKNLADDYVPRPDDRPLTKFEARGHRLGHGVWDLMFQKLKLTSSDN